jgi:hypothetical protein
LFTNIEESLICARNSFIEERKVTGSFKTEPTILLVSAYKRQLILLPV